MTVVLLHDLGAEAAGAPWRRAAPGWHAPDLPGHGTQPAPRHGAYDPMGPATLARWAVADDPDRSLVVGVGQNAHAALILAAGRACGGVAIVDGLWGPWQTAADAIREMYDGLRRVLGDPSAVGPAPASGLDPRTKHGYGIHVSPPFARRFWGEVQVPVLAIETPASRTPPTEREERVGWFAGRSGLVEVDAADPAEIVAVVQGWWADCR